MSANTFGKHSVIIDTDTASLVLELVRTLDFQTMAKAQVMALNALQLNLEAVLEEEKVESLVGAVEVFDDGVNSQEFTNSTDNVGDR